MSTQFTTGVVRASYVNVFQPRKDDDGNEYFSMQLIIPKSDKQTLSKIQAAHKAAVAKKWGTKTPRNLYSTLRDGDEYNSDLEADGKSPRPELKNHYFVNVKTNTPPGVVDRQVQAILDPREFVSGDYCIAQLNAAGYDHSGNKGVSYYLNHVQVIRKGEPLGGQGRAEDAFEAYEDDADDEAFLPGKAA